MNKIDSAIKQADEAVTRVMDRHTPGPWRAMQGSINFPPLLVRAVRLDKAICDCDYQDGVEGEANAKLIAAAPAMLAKLRELYDWFDQTSTEHPAPYQLQQQLLRKCAEITETLEGAG